MNQLIKSMLLSENAWLYHILIKNLYILNYENVLGQNFSSYLNKRNIAINNEYDIQPKTILDETALRTIHASKIAKYRGRDKKSRKDTASVEKLVSTT